MPGFGMSCLATGVGGGWLCVWAVVVVGWSSGDADWAAGIVGWAAGWESGWAVGWESGGAVAGQFEPIGPLAG